MSDNEAPAGLVSYGITAANVIEATESDDSMFIAYRDEAGKTWGLVIEFDEAAVRETADYLRKCGVVVKRERA